MSQTGENKEYRENVFKENQPKNMEDIGGGLQGSYKRKGVGYDQDMSYTCKKNFKD